MAAGGSGGDGSGARGGAGGGSPPRVERRRIPPPSPMGRRRDYMPSQGPGARDRDREDLHYVAGIDSRRPEISRSMRGLPSTDPEERLRDGPAYLAAVEPALDALSRLKAYLLNPKFRQYNKAYCEQLEDLIYHLSLLQDRDAQATDRLLKLKTQESNMFFVFYRLLITQEVLIFSKHYFGAFIARFFKKDRARLDSMDDDDFIDYVQTVRFVMKYIERLKPYHAANPSDYPFPSELEDEGALRRVNWVVNDCGGKTGDYACAPSVEQKITLREYRFDEAKRFMSEHRTACISLFNGECDSQLAVLLSAIQAGYKAMLKRLNSRAVDFLEELNPLLFPRQYEQVLSQELIPDEHHPQTSLESLLSAGTTNATDDFHHHKDGFMMHLEIADSLGSLPMFIQWLGGLCGNGTLLFPVKFWGLPAKIESFFQPGMRSLKAYPSGHPYSLTSEMVEAYEPISANFMDPYLAEYEPEVDNRDAWMLKWLVLNAKPNGEWYKRPANFDIDRTTTEFLRTDLLDLYGRSLIRLANKYRVASGVDTNEYNERFRAFSTAYRIFLEQQEALHLGTDINELLTILSYYKPEDVAFAVHASSELHYREWLFSGRLPPSLVAPTYAPERQTPYTHALTAMNPDRQVLRHLREVLSLRFHRAAFGPVFTPIRARRPAEDVSDDDFERGAAGGAGGGAAVPLNLGEAGELTFPRWFNPLKQDLIHLISAVAHREVPPPVGTSTAQFLKMIINGVDGVHRLRGKTPLSTKRLAKIKSHEMNMVSTALSLLRDASLGKAFRVSLAWVFERYAPHLLELDGAPLVHVLNGIDRARMYYQKLKKLQAGPSFPSLEALDPDNPSNYEVYWVSHFDFRSMTMGVQVTELTMEQVSEYLPVDPADLELLRLRLPTDFVLDHDAWGLCLAEKWGEINRIEGVDNYRKFMTIRLNYNMVKHLLPGRYIALIDQIEANADGLSVTHFRQLERAFALLELLAKNMTPDQLTEEQLAADYEQKSLLNTDGVEDRDLEYAQAAKIVREAPALLSFLCGDDLTHAEAFVLFAKKAYKKASKTFNILARQFLSEVHIIPVNTYYPFVCGPTCNLPEDSLDADSIFTDRMALSTNAPTDVISYMAWGCGLFWPEAPDPGENVQDVFRDISNQTCVLVEEIHGHGLHKKLYACAKGFEQWAGYEEGETDLNPLEKNAVATFRPTDRQSRTDAWLIDMSSFVFQRFGARTFPGVPGMKGSYFDPAFVLQRLSKTEAISTMMRGCLALMRRYRKSHHYDRRTHHHQCGLSDDLLSRLSAYHAMMEGLTNADCVPVTDRSKYAGVTVALSRLTALTHNELAVVNVTGNARLLAELNASLAPQTLELIRSGTHGGTKSRSHSKWLKAMHTWEAWQCEDRDQVLKMNPVDRFGSDVDDSPTSPTALITPRRFTGGDERSTDQRLREPPPVVRDAEHDGRPAHVLTALLLSPPPEPLRRSRSAGHPVSPIATRRARADAVVLRREGGARRRLAMVDDGPDGAAERK